MNKLIIKEVVERDVTPTQFPVYRKEKNSDVFFAIYSNYIIKTYVSSLNHYINITRGSYEVLGDMAMSVITVECSADEFLATYNRAYNLLNAGINEPNVTITHEGDE
jgi:hypothetical protein